MSSNSQYWCDDNSTYVAKSLVSASGWNTNASLCTVGNEQDQNNTSGFNLQPLGSLSSNPFGYGFGYFGDRGGIWTSSPRSEIHPNEKDAIQIFNSDQIISQTYTNYIYNGLAVRCIKD